jgi:hypothetical protein
MGLLMSIIRIFWKYLTPITTSVFALMLLLFWTTSPVPSRDELVEIDGVLASYTVEADQSKFAKFMRRQHNYVLFKLENRDGRFWSEYLGANARTVFSHIGVPVRLYVSPNPRTHSINGDAVKTYGLFVDGSEIVSPENAVGVDSMLVRWVFPALGMILLYLAWRSWKKLACQAT